MTLKHALHVEMEEYAVEDIVVVPRVSRESIAISECFANRIV